MNSIIKSAIQDGRLILLFGAGASITSFDKDGNFLMGGKDLAAKLCEAAAWAYSGEHLAVVYSAAKNVLGERLNAILEHNFRHCEPSEEYKIIAKYPWARIYTLNIDDSFDTALREMSPQNVFIRHKTDKVFDQDQLFNRLDFIKLNGSVCSLGNGLIFSPKEYGEASASAPLWYKELAKDFFMYTFLFVGTQLDESLFYHQIERYRSQSQSIHQRSYVLTPTATEIEKSSLSTFNLEHISGTLADFASWLIKTFPTPPTPLQLAVKRNPILAELISITEDEKKKEFASAFQDVTLVSRLHLSKIRDQASDTDKVRNYYRGFKPSWTDILDEVPAVITSSKEFAECVLNAFSDDNRFVLLHGPAGTGKSTLMKQIALLVFEKTHRPVYFIDTPVNSLINIIEKLENSNQERFFLFYDRIDAVKDDVTKAFELGLIKKCLFVGSERQHKWESTVKEHLEPYLDAIYNVSLIDKSDASLILEKLEKYGPWTRLGRMKPNERLDELVDRAKRQLLIGLLETTFGVGFTEMIESEFRQISDGPAKSFFVLVGLATYHRLPISESLVLRALGELGIEVGINNLAQQLGGIVYQEYGKLYARHPVYVQHLFHDVIDTKMIFDTLMGIFKAFSAYKSPVPKYAGRIESHLFRNLINHQFIKYIFRSNSSYMIKFYDSFEKAFQNDGLFLLQYGLALRDIGEQPEAFEKFQSAVEAYSTPHTEHALAQQELIMACQIGSSAKAHSLLDKARETLERLDRTRLPSNMYPIVALSEGHTSVVRIYEGDEQGRVVAKHYANIIGQRIKGHQGGRLKQSWIRLTTYATTGIWQEDREEGFVC